MQQQDNKPNKFKLPMILGGIALFFYAAGIVSIMVA